MPGKIWPAERWVALAQRLLSWPGFETARVVLLGGPGEEALSRPLIDALGARAVDLVGALRLPEAAAILTRFAVVRRQ